MWLYAFYALVIATVGTYGFFQGRFLKTPLTRTSIALVIAHPDDEVMFFGPTLAELTRQEHGNTVRVLCLSSGKLTGSSVARKNKGKLKRIISNLQVRFQMTIRRVVIGNHDGIGDTRKKELVASCRSFGLREAQVTLVDHPYVSFFELSVVSCQDHKNGRSDTNTYFGISILDSRELKDGPNELWHPSLVGDQINMFVKKHNIETVSITGSRTCTWMDGMLDPRTDPLTQLQPSHAFLGHHL